MWSKLFDLSVYSTSRFFIHRMIVKLYTFDVHILAV